MTIKKHLKNLKIEGKTFVLLIVTPKDKYPTNYLDNNYYVFLNKILISPESYIGVYNEKKPEIMQEVAFNIYIRPLIIDIHRMSTNTMTKTKRLNEEEIQSYFALRKFFSTVPYGELIEPEAIEQGLIEAEEFLMKYPSSEYEYASVNISKNEEEVNVLMNIALNDVNEGYYLNYVYVR